MTIAADRRRHPVVRLVRVQPRLHAVGAWTSGASAGSRPTPRWPPAPAACRALFFVYPRSKKWDTGITVNGFLAGLVAITCPCYWVNPTRRDHHRRHRRRDRGARRRPPRVAPDRRPDRRGAGPRLLRHLGHAQPRAVRHRPVRRARADRRGHAPPSSTGLFYGGGVHQLVGPGHRQRHHHRVRPRRRLRPDVRRQGSPGRCASREEGELEGIDIHEHGAPAYHPEFGFMGVAGVGSGSTGGAGTSAPAGRHGQSDACRLTTFSVRGGPRRDHPGPERADRIRIGGGTSVGRGGALLAERRRGRHPVA